jgi:hypothetical protein
MTAERVRRAWETTAGADAYSVSWALGVSPWLLLLLMARLGVRPPASPR